MPAFVVTWDDPGDDRYRLCLGEIRTMTLDNPNDMTVSADASLAETMRTMDRVGTGFVAVVNDDGRFRGTATDGDIRRGILDGLDLDTAIAEVTTEDSVVLNAEDVSGDVSGRLDLEELRRRTSDHETLIVPVVSEGHVLGFEQVDRNGRVVSNQSVEAGRNVETVLVIGGAGYIGSVLSRELLSAGYDVRVLDMLLYGRQGVEDLADDDRFTLMEGDMRSIADVTEAIRGVDAVIHLGALVGDPASSIDAQKTLEMNLHAVRLAAGICKYHQVNRFLFASTCSVYGLDEENELLTETSELNPVSLYAQTKIDSEEALLDMADGNFSPTILRMATIYGLSPRMRFDLVVNILSAKAHDEGRIPIFGGDQYRPNVHVADAARAYIACLEAPIQDVSSEVFNVGSNAQNYRVEEIGEMVSEVFPDATIDHQPENEDDRSYRVDFSKIHDRLDYEVRRTIPDAAREIKQALAEGRFPDYTKTRYSNYKTLESELDAAES